MYFQYQGAEYEYHEPVQTPIAPPYEEALSLAKNRDFHMADVSVIIENECMSEISAYKKACRTKTNTEAKTTEDDDEVPIDVLLQNLYIPETESWMSFYKNVYVFVETLFSCCILEMNAQTFLII